MIKICFEQAQTGLPGTIQIPSSRRIQVVAVAPPTSWPPTSRTARNAVTCPNSENIAFVNVKTGTTAVVLCRG
jgi:hypothetical protein